MPAPTAPAVSAPASTGNHVHVVAPGETLMKLSRHYRKPLTTIAKANNVAPHTKVKVGDRIGIPGARGRRGAGARRRRRLPEGEAAELRAASGRVGAPGRQRQSGDAGRARSASRQGQAELTGAMPSFRWPVRGRVIAGFGPKPNGQQNDGINVAVPEGTPVKAAEDGVVAYAGNELKGYGNLVLVRHSNGFVTAYAHASELMVKRGDTVKRGQVIAKAGQTGNVTAPQLHFEIRKGSTPVDPTQYLNGA